MIRLRLLIFCALFITILGIGYAQVAFTEDEDIDKQKANLDGRKPLYSPARCSQYQLLYPGDQHNDWICDCAPAALYHPETDACYPAYRQGPCKEAEILVLYPEKKIPECVNNPCRRDGHFMIREKCFQFGNIQSIDNPCPNKDLTFVLGVNPKTLMVDCIQLSTQIGTRISDADDAPPNYHIDLAEKCLRGSRLNAEGRCVTAPLKVLK